MTAQDPNRLTPLDEIAKRMIAESERRKLLPRTKGRETLRTLMPTLATLRDQNYSWGEIAEICEVAGLKNPQGKPYQAGTLRSAFATLNDQADHTNA